MSDSTWWLEYDELDEGQREIVNLGPDGNYLILGPPGSGKTNLLLLRASYLARSQRPNILVLVSTRSLREFIANGATHYKLQSEQVQTLATWGLSFLREHGCSTESLPKEPIENRRAVAAKMSSLVEDNPLLEGSIECIFVDEIQDCLQEEIDMFFRLGRNVCFAGDGKQRIYDVELLLEPLQERFGSENTKTLAYHYRNGVQICKAADAISKTSGEAAIEPTCNYNEPRNRSTVEFQDHSEAEDQIGAVVQKLASDLVVFPGELLGVACPMRADADMLRQALLDSKLGRYVLPEKCFQENAEQQIYVTTLHDFKGLEFRTAHLVFMENLYKLRSAQKRIAFTAVTRAKTYLTIYSNGKIPGYLQQACAACMSAAEAPDPSSLFPGQKKQ